MVLAGEDSKGFDAQFARKLSGVHTEFVFQRFANKWFLLITQYGKLPNLYSVQFDLKYNELPAANQAPINHPEFHVSVPLTIKCLFGPDKDEVRGGIQYLVNRSNLNKCPTDFIIGLGLKELNGKRLHEVAEVLNEVIT